MKEIVQCLLIQRSDGKFLHLDEQRHTTTASFVDDPEKAYRIIPWANHKLDITKPPEWFMENSDRGRNWVKDCKTVPYEITTEITAVVMTDPLSGAFIDKEVEHVVTKLDESTKSHVNLHPREDFLPGGIKAVIEVDGLEEIFKDSSDKGPKDE